VAGRRRDRVVAEITVAHIRQLAMRFGCPASEDHVLTFLNEDGHAYAQWMRMKQAGEEFIKSNLPRVLSKADSTKLTESAAPGRSYYFPTTANGISDLKNNLRIRTNDTLSNY
jgi:hypothetical protein